jgi:hypothetical protein
VDPGSERLDLCARKTGGAPVAPSLGSIRFLAVDDVRTMAAHLAEEPL